MPDFVLILWLPVTIAIMAVTWVFTLGAVGRAQASAAPSNGSTGGTSKRS